MIEFDHIAIAGETLAEATGFVETALGFPLQPGGEHAVFHTHNTLLGLQGGLYLEAIAANPDAPTPDRPRWFDLDRFTGSPRLTNWICRVPDLDAALSTLPMDLGEPVDLERGNLKWRMAVPNSGRLPFDNCAPALIEWQTDIHPASKLAQQGVELVDLSISHPEAEQLSDILAPFLRDSRITFEQGSAGLSARFQTPAGPKYIGR